MEGKKETKGEPQEQETEGSGLWKAPEEEFKGILGAHQKWLESKGKEGTRANLQDANLLGVDLHDARLGKANLKKADLRYADLQKADLERADLQGAYLWEAILQHAYLGRANLQDAYLCEADLKGANLGYANLRGADLGDAEMRGVSSFTVKQLSEVKTLCGAKLDQELMEEIQKGYPHLLDDQRAKL